VRLYHLAQQRSDDAVLLLCAELNETRTVFPKTDLRMFFELGSAKIPAQLASISEVGDSAKSLRSGCLQVKSGYLQWATASASGLLNYHDFRDKSHCQIAADAGYHVDENNIDSD